MEFKRGNTYKLNATISGIDPSTITKIVFKFNDVKKTYLANGDGDVELNDGVFVVNLTQEETLRLKTEKVKYEVAVKFTDGQVKKSKVYYTNSLETIIEEEI